jgi:hypothetical protein
MQFLFELVFQFFGELLLESAVRVLANRVVRVVLPIAAGLGVGYWWGARLTELGRTELPRPPAPASPPVSTRNR